MSAINDKKDDGDFIRVEWDYESHTEGVFSKNSTLALKTAIGKCPKAI
jgi:hypothetical protein